MIRFRLNIAVTLSLVAMLVVAAATGCSGPSPTGDDDTDAAVPRVPSDVDGRLTINELMTANAATTFDDSGAAADWIELYNPTDVDVPLGGYFVSDDLAVPNKAVLAWGLVVPAGGYLILWLDGAPERGIDHVDVQLASEGGAIGFARPDGSYIDRVEYLAQETDFSAAREPDGSDAWIIEWHASPGTANPAGDGQPLGLEILAAPPEQVPAAGDLSELILGYDVILEIALTVSPPGVASLEADPRTYVQAMIVYDGRTYGPVGVRLKGQNSFQPFSMKPSLRINVDEYVPGARFFGLKDLTLNNMDNDPSMMHERLSYYVARQAGLPASRANHALLTVNGMFYGLYMNVETIKRQMIRRWYADDTGPLFEATDVDFAPEYVDLFELESGPDDRGLITGLANALTNPSADGAMVAAANYVDLVQFQRFWALCSVVGQFDSFPYSFPGDDYYMYADPDSNRLSFIPSGMDETFFSASFDVLQVQSLLALKCMASPVCFQAYVDEAWDLLEMTEAADLMGERGRVAAQIASYVAMDTRKPYTTATVIDYQAAQGWFISERRLWLTQMLPAPSPGP